MKITCDICGKSASVHVGFVHGQKLSHAAYCQEHAELAGVLDSSAYGLLDDGQTHDIPALAVSGGLQCSHCGLTLRQWKQTGRVGCAHCYMVFHNDIELILPRMHRGQQHVGRMPRQQISPGVVTNRIRKLKDDLERAVKDERYEDAALARDEMSHLRDQLEGLK